MANRENREYESTHPWLNFNVELNRLEWRSWMLLGEAVSKCDHVANTPLQTSYARSLHSIYLAKGAAATTRIEGNTLTDEQVRKILENEYVAPPSKEYLQQEVENVLELYNDPDLIERPLTVDLICEINRRVLRGLKLNDEAVAGEIRNYQVGVLRYRGAPAADCEFLLERLCEFAESPAGELPSASQRMGVGILKAFITHLNFVWIHPFGDGNGRTGRVLEYMLLSRIGCPRPTTLLPTTFYSETRPEYYRVLSESSSRNDWTIFVSYALQGFVDGLKEQLSHLWEQLIELSWRDFYREKINSAESSSVKTRERLLRLVAFISEHPGGLEKTEMLDSFPGRLAIEYGGKTPRKLDRDLKFLRDSNLVIVKGGRISANKEAILAFRPHRRFE